MSNFSTVDRVQATIRAGDAVERVRQENRIKVTDAANCVPPLTKEEAKKIGIKITFRGAVCSSFVPRSKAVLDCFPK